MYLSLILFLIGILGFVLNKKNIILMLISIEIMLLAITFLILVSSLNFDDIIGNKIVQLNDINWSNLIRGNEALTQINVNIIIHVLSPKLKP